MKLNQLLCFATVFLFLGCQTPGYFIPDNQLQLPDIRKAVNAVIGKPRYVSINGREMVSEFHDEKFQHYDENGKSKLRYQTKVIILGTRRPYEINVLVSQDQFENQTKTYVLHGIDEGLSRQRAIIIKKALNLSLDKQSGFDGDKPF
ncbi:MAG: hypothetical protein H7235_08175 [Bdellovibrionaceae bacterium]|nr:hypothetical protein [Pseudobdellovibrionaceae bacterium]